MRHYSTPKRADFCMVIRYKKPEELLNEEKQRNGVKTKCASSLSPAPEWSAIDWDKCELGVRKLQRRIVEALVFQMPGSGKWKDENIYPEIVKQYTNSPSYKSEEEC